MIKLFDWLAEQSGIMAVLTSTTVNNVYMYFDQLNVGVTCYQFSEIV